MCKQLRGWLKKRHQTVGFKRAPRWGSRHFLVDDEGGLLLYSKSQAASERLMKVLVRLSDVTTVESGDGCEDLPPHCIVLHCQSAPAVVLGAEDREEAAMWIAQLGARAAKFRREADL